MAREWRYSAKGSGGKEKMKETKGNFLFSFLFSVQKEALQRSGNDRVWEGKKGKKGKNSRKGSLSHVQGMGTDEKLQKTN